MSTKITKQQKLRWTHSLSSPAPAPWPGAGSPPASELTLVLAWASSMPLAVFERVRALRTVKQNNPGLKVVVTMGTTTSGPDADGQRLTDAQAYTHMGISSMNGKTDNAGETATLGNFNSILSYAQTNHLARLTYWSANRDRACGSGGDGDTYSGVSQSAGDFSKVIGKFTG